MIIFENVQKKYGSYQLDLSMELPSGKITGLIGKNGAGKSTVIKLMLGLIRPDSGKIQIFGKDISHLTPKEKEKIGVSLAESVFSVQLTIADIEKILAKMYPAFQGDYFLRKCREYHLHMNKRIKDFSTGMRAKLRVLIAITHEAKLLIMDEPTAGLDVEARNDVLDLLREYMAQDEERSILITSHISSDLETLCDDLYLIHEGQMILHEDTDVVLERYGVVKADEKQYAQLDQDYILKSQKVSYGYACFVSDRQFFLENYPDIVVEKGTIDELILMMTGGYR